MGRDSHTEWVVLPLHLHPCISKRPPDAHWEHLQRLLFLKPSQWPQVLQPRDLASCHHRHLRPSSITKGQCGTWPFSHICNPQDSSVAATTRESSEPPLRALPKSHLQPSSSGPSLGPFWMREN